MDSWQVRIGVIKRMKMTSINKKYLLLLRLFLVGAGVAWGVSVFGLVLPWEMVDGELGKLGAESVNDAMVQYWL